MSAALDAALQTAPAPVRRYAPRRLEAVQAGRRRPRRMYGVIAVVGALTIASMQLGLSILTTQTSYALSDLTQRQRELTWQKQILDDQIAGLNSPQYLAANATALGMVVGQPPSYLRLSDGALLGSGEVSSGASSVDALGRALVGNELITSTPLVTDPRASLATPTPAPTPTPSAAPDATTAPGATTAPAPDPTPAIPTLTGGLPPVATR